MKLIETHDGVALEVSVKPRSRRFKITLDGDEVIVCCTEEPTKGKVNKELVKELSRLFHAEVILVSGFTSKQKKLLVKDVKRSVIEKVLKSQ